MKYENLTLTGIDGMRHLVGNEIMVKAIAFAVRAGHNDRTAHRFVVTLVASGNLDFGTLWPEILQFVRNLEMKP